MESEKAINYQQFYYLIGLLAGLACGVIIDKTIVLTAVLGIVGVLFAGFFRNAFVKGRGNNNA